MVTITPYKKYRLLNVLSPLFAEHPLRRPPSLLSLGLGLCVTSDLDLGRERLGAILRLRGQSRGHHGGSRGQAGVRPGLGWGLVLGVSSAIHRVMMTGSSWGRSGLDWLLK